MCVAVWREVRVEWSCGIEGVGGVGLSLSVDISSYKMGKAEPLI